MCRCSVVMSVDLSQLIDVRKTRRQQPLEKRYISRSLSFAKINTVPFGAKRITCPTPAINRFVYVSEMIAMPLPTAGAVAACCCPLYFALAKTNHRRWEKRLISTRAEYRLRPAQVDMRLAASPMLVRLAATRIGRRGDVTGLCAWPVPGPGAAFPRRSRFLAGSPVRAGHG